MNLKTKLKLGILAQTLLDAQYNITDAVQEDIPQELFKPLCQIDEHIHKFRSLIKDYTEKVLT